MKKRLIAMLLCMILCLTVLPVCAFAGEGLTAAGTSVSPLTGDESNVVLWVVVGVVALAGIVGIVLYLISAKNKISEHKIHPRRPAGMNCVPSREPGEN